MHEDPLKLIPLEVREEFLEELNEMLMLIKLKLKGSKPSLSFYLK
jgi:hypothetical protein